MKSIVWIVLGLLVFAESALANARVSSVSVTGDTLVIQGELLGTHCKNCEVIGSFASLRYSLEVVSWTEGQIKARLVDLGRGVRVKVQVVTPDWRSKSVWVKLSQKILPRTRVKRMITQATDKMVFFTREYDSSLGGKGEEAFEVNMPLPACGKSGPIFDSAEILIGRRSRFGEAKITRMPAAGCDKCEMRVRYYWEPTGRLHYQLHVYRRIVEGICQARVR